jgi:hypothetical protein
MLITPIDLLRGLLQFGLENFGLTGLGVGVGTLMTTGLWLWWGFKLKGIAALVATVGRTATRHALVSVLFSAALFGLLFWTGIIPGVNIQAAIDVLTNGIDVTLEALR